MLSGGALLVAEPIERKRAPANVVEAQFSAPFAAALALTRCGAGPREYTPESVERSHHPRLDGADGVLPRP